MLTICCSLTRAEHLKPKLITYFENICHDGHFIEQEGDDAIKNFLELTKQISSGHSNESTIASNFEASFKILEKLGAFADNCGNEELKKKIDDIHHRMAEMMKNMAEYVHEFSPSYKALKRLRKIWTEKSKSHQNPNQFVEDKIRGFFFDVNENSGSCRILDMLKYSEKFFGKYSELLSDNIQLQKDIAELNDRHNVNSEHKKYVAIGCVLLLLGIVIGAAAPICLPLESYVVGGLFGCGITVAGSGAFSLFHARRLQEDTERNHLAAIRVRERLTDMLTKMEKKVAEYSESVEMVRIITEENNEFDVMSCDKMCATFDSMETALQNIHENYNGKSSNALLGFATGAAAGAATTMCLKGA